MSLLDDIDELENQSDKIVSFKNEVKGLHEKALLCRGFVNAVVYKDEEKFMLKKISGIYGVKSNYLTPFAQKVEELISNAVFPELQVHQQRSIYSLDCRTLCKGDAYWWLSKVSQASKDPILVIEHITEIPDGDRTIYDDPEYVANLLLRSWKNEQIFVGDLYIDRTEFTIILTCQPKDEDILLQECGQCSYSWLGDYNAYFKETHDLAASIVEGT